MASSDDDLLRLRHMLEATREVVAFTEGASESDLDTDRKLLRALSMSIGIMGEAASQISEEFRNARPEIPWRQVISTRNFLVHDYFMINNKILWTTAVDDVPKLLAQLETILPPEESHD